MVTIYEHQDNVFQVEVGEQLSEADTQIYLDRFTAALAHPAPFGSIFSYRGRQPRKSRTAERRERAWVKQHRTDIRRHCFGIALVSNPSVVTMLVKLMLKGAGERVFGCPVTLVASVEEAQMWLRAQRAIYVAQAHIQPNT